MGPAEVFKARVALLRDMLDAVRDDNIGSSHDFWRGYYAALNAFKEWMSMQNGPNTAGGQTAPIDMPAVEEGIEPCSRS